MKLKMKCQLTSTDGQVWTLSRLDYLSCDSNLDTGELNQDEKLRLIQRDALGFKVWETKFKVLGDVNILQNRRVKCLSCGQYFRSNEKDVETCPDCMKGFQAIVDRARLAETEGEMLHD